MQYSFSSRGISPRSFLFAVRGCAVGALFFFAQSASAVDTTWTFNGDGNWATPANWSAGEPNISTFTAIIDDGDSAVTVTLNASRTIGALILGADDAVRIENTAAATTLTLANGFINDGSLLLSGTGGGNAQLTITTGTLTNGATGVLHFQNVGLGGRLLNSDLINNGTVLVDRNTTFAKTSGSYTNNNQLSVGTGITLNVNSGAAVLNQNAGTFDLNGSLILAAGAAINMNGGTLDIAANSTISGGTFNYTGGIINGTATLTNSTLMVGPDAGSATSFVIGSSSALASDIGAGHTVTVRTGNTSTTLTSAVGFTNDGTIGLTGNGSGVARLTLASGTLNNSSTGLIHIQSGPGSRAFSGDLINNGEVRASLSATFDKAGGSYANNGKFVVEGGALAITNGGTLTNFSGTTLTGGMYDVTGTFRFPGANIVTNQAEIILRGATSQILNDTGGGNALAGLVTNGASGALRLLAGRNFTAAGAFSNAGDFELGGGTFGAPSLTNTATGELFGFGTVTPRPTNSGAIRAAGGTLAFSNGIQGGTVQVNAGASLDLSGGVQGSNANVLVHNGAGLNLGSNNFSISTDYQNGNFGVGNAFNHRANVTGAGQINASPGITQTLTGNNIANGATATALMSFGNIHVGSSTTLNYQINNVGASGPSLRGAIQTTAGGGNVTDSRLTGDGASAGNFGPIAAGANSGNQSVTFNATSAGPLTSQQVRIVNNFDNVGDQTLAFAGAAYRLANPTTHTPEPVNLGNRHVGDVNPSQTISLTNNVPADGFSESLNASITLPTGGVTHNSGTIAALAPGATNNTSLAVGYSTATPGNKAGTATITLTSNGTGSSGLGLTSLPAQTVNVTGGVYRLATASPHSPEPVNLGIVHVGDVVQQALAISNIAINDAFSEQLNGAMGVTTGAATTNGGSFSGLAPGSTDTTSLAVGINTATAGNKVGSAAINLASTGASTSGLADTALTSQTVNVQAQVNNFASAHIFKVGAGGTLTFNGPNQFTLNLGTTVQGGSDLSAQLGVLNNVAAPADSLGGAFNLAAPGYTLAGFESFSDLAAGASRSGLMITLDSATAGTITGLITLSPQSTNPRPFSMGLPNVTINLTGVVQPAGGFSGDFDEDGNVDGDDLTNWKGGFGTSGSAIHIQGDADGDHDVDGDDFLVWQRQLGSAASVAATRAVPEPATMFLLVSGVLVISSRRRVAES
jgi:hypothetical protein